MEKLKKFTYFLFSIANFEYSMAIIAIVLQNFEQKMGNTLQTSHLVGKKL